MIRGLTLEQHLNDPVAFGMAMRRVRDRHAEAGIVTTFGQLMREAREELNAANQRLAAKIAQQRASRR